MVKISACVIVKNEAANIGHWLECVRGIADEIIVVDTGSTDNTVELAKSGGARVEFFAWINDFAAAKNYALSLATGQWIIFLDADEFFSIQAQPKIRGIIEQYQRNPKVVGIICQLINIDRDNNNRFLSTASQVRIFRNLPSLRYEGKVHEFLANKLSSDRRFEVCREVEIYHTGYSAGIQRQKVERNLKILIDGGQTETVENALAMMDCYYGLGEYEKAAVYAKRAIDSGIRYIGLESHPYETLVDIYSKIKPADETLALIAEAKQVFPEAAVFLMYEGVAYFDQQEYTTAEKAFTEAVALSKEDKTKDKLEHCLSDSGTQHLPLAFYYLGELRRLRDDLAGAVDYYLASLRGFPYQVNTLRKLLKCLNGVPAEDLIAMFDGIYDKHNDAEFLTECLNGTQEAKLFLYYSRFVKKHNAVAEFLAAGRMDAAAVYLADRIERLAAFGVFAVENMNLSADNELKVLVSEEYYCKKGRETEEKPPKVSILIPTYNRPRLFEETLKSALGQQYDDFEVIVCDNSTNELTAEVIARYKNDKRLRYYRNREAKTKADNFRPFEQLARGEFLQWCMDDDILLPNKLAKMAAVLDNNPTVTLVASQRNVIDETGREIKKAYKSLGIKKEYEQYSGKKVGWTLLVNFSNFIGEPSAVLFRRRDLTNHYWGAESRGYKAISDMVMWLELLEKGDCVIFKEPLSSYRLHAGQEGAQQDVVLLSRIEWVRIIEEYYQRKIFLVKEEDYKDALGQIYREYKRTIIADDFGSAKMRTEYFAEMKKIGELLGNNYE